MQVPVIPTPRLLVSVAIQYAPTFEELVAHLYESRHVHVYIIMVVVMSVLVHSSPLVSPPVCDEYILHLILNLWRLSVATTATFPVQHQLAPDTCRLLP